MGDAFITRRGGGGGSAGLNFEVIGGTTQPKNPKENTIWVNTNQAITRWDISAKHPYLASNTKNFICYPFYDPTLTTNGMAYTDNGDGTVKANGVAISDATFRLSFIGADDHATYLPAGKYFLSGCPAGGSGSGYRVEAKSVASGETLALDYGSGAAFELDYPCAVRCNIVVASGAVVSNLTFKPQLEKGSAATAFVAGDATGQVWISAGTSSGVEFNALKNNNIQVYPISAKQYIGGEWAEKAAKSYQNGAWVDFFTGVYLFNRGNQCADETGGWASAKNCAGSIEIGSNAISIDCNGVASKDTYFAVYTKQKIDITDYQKLVFNEDWMTSITSGGNAFVRAGLFSSIPNSMSTAKSYAVAYLADGDGAVLDVSSVKGTYYVCIAGGFYGSANYALSADITEVYKE